MMMMWKPGHDDEINEENGGGDEGEDADCQDGPVLKENIITLFGEEVPAYKQVLGKISTIVDPLTLFGEVEVPVSTCMNFFPISTT